MVVPVDPLQRGAFEVLEAAPRFLLALIASIVGALIGGSVVIERLFSLPGVGAALISGVSYYDYPLVQGIVMFVGLGFIVISLLLDLLVGWLDPRIRDAAR